MLDQVETRLLLGAASLVPPPDLSDLVSQAAEDGIDWHEFTRLAVEHRLLLCVAKSLASVEQVPAAVRADLSRKARRWSMRSLRATADAQRAQAALDAAGVANIVLKGPALARMLYGDPAARMFVDIDLFVAPVDLDAASGVITRLGYTSTAWTAWTPERIATATRAFHSHDVGFRSPDGGVRIELHWRATGHSFYDATEAALIACLGESDPTKTRAPFAAQVLIHGATHSYRRLGWLRDAGALCTVLTTEEWRQVLVLAEADRAPNAVLLGPYLAHRLLGAALPAVVVERIRERELLVQALGGHCTFPTVDHGGIEEAGALKTQLLLRDQRLDQMRYLAHKIGRLDPGQMNANTLRGGWRGSCSRTLAQGPKFSRFVQHRLWPRVKRAIATRSGT